MNDQNSHSCVEQKILATGAESLLSLLDRNEKKLLGELQML